MSSFIYNSSDDEEPNMDLEQFAEMQTRKDSKLNSKKRSHDIAFIDQPTIVPINKLTKSKDLHHIIEKIFLCLTHTDLVACKSTNTSLKQVFENPYFLLKKWKLCGLSKGYP